MSRMLRADLTEIMAHSRDWDELQHTWVEWYRKSGQKMRDLYEQLVELSNFAARLNSKSHSTFLQNKQYSVC